MTVKVAINGFGRIGRCILRSIYEYNKNHDISVVAINDGGEDLKIHSYLLKHDSVHGLFANKISFNEDGDNKYLTIDNDKINFYSLRNPADLPWGDLDVDVVLECTGVFTSKKSASEHLKSGAKKVLLSAPAKDDVDATIVYGVNHTTITRGMRIISNASCTTNCLAPIVRVLHDAFGIENGLMTTIHSYTKDQSLIDSYHEDMHRARAATLSMIPTKTGAAKAVSLVIPELKGKLDGVAVRVPTPNVSLVDFKCTTKKATNREEINEIMIKYANSTLKGILDVTDEPFVSIDFNHNPHSAIFDLSQTKVIGNLIQIYSWYDNEWGFSNRMIDTALLMAKTL